MDVLDAVRELRDELRQIRTDLATLQMTAGEAEALHSHLTAPIALTIARDIDTTITKHRELEARIIILERQIEVLRSH